MKFLQESNDYSDESALDYCLSSKMYLECAYLNFKKGNTEEGIKLLNEHDHNLTNLKEVIDLAVSFNINSESLWDKIISRSHGDAKRIEILLQYSDIYKEPRRFIDSLDDDI
jgi:hypothetical protein